MDNDEYCSKICHYRRSGEVRNALPLDGEPRNPLPLKRRPQIISLPFKGRVRVGMGFTS